MEESSYLSLPTTSWHAVDPDDLAEVRRIGRAILDLDLASPSHTPEDLATQMGSVAERILATVAGEERDMRAMIDAFRTCLAVTWDMYDKIAADETTVTGHIEALRERIQSLEADLTVFRLEGGITADE